MTKDLIIVGAGPAGISAAIEATRLGLSVLVLDENAAPGGRIWQALEARFATRPPVAATDEAALQRGRREPIPDRGQEYNPDPRAAQPSGARGEPHTILDPDDAAALDLLREFRACPADTHHRATVWAIEPDGTVFWTRDGTARATRATRILLATGTTERAMPIPGWTLPGVMTVGAAQIALKTAGLVPDGGTWIAGQGPLLLLYIVQALRAGGRFAGVLDTSDGFAPFRALRHLSPRAWPEISKGLAWRREVTRAGVPWHSATELRAEGEGELRRISFRAGDALRTEPADLLLLHDGVIPSVQITRALGCAHEWDAAQRSWKPATDPWGVTSLGNVLVAGDAAGIGGALAATCAGHVAAIGVAHALGRIDAATRDRAVAPWRMELNHHTTFRGFLNALYTPRPPVPEDSTVVCRCEEVTAGDIRAAVGQGCLGLNQLKAFTRAGMGPCQGRMCGTNAAEVMAEARGMPPEAVEPFRARFPVKPLSLGELATLDAQPR